MPLTSEQIANLYNKPKKAAPASTRASTGGAGKSNKRRLSRIHTQYAKLPPNNLVKYTPGEHSQRCTSFGCGAPTYYMLSGSPLCSMHIVFALVHELNHYTHNGTVQTEASGDLPDCSPGQGAAAVLASITHINKESGEDGDNQYL